MATLRPLPNPPQPSLAARVKAIQLDLEDWLETRVKAEHADLVAQSSNGECGIPLEALRDLTTRGSSCLCAIFLEKDKS